VAANLLTSLRSPGRLCIEPSNLGGTFPFGGTDIGMSVDIDLEPVQHTEWLREEGFGKETLDGIALGESWVIRAVVRKPNETALAAVMLDGTWASGSYTYPSSFKPGYLMSNKAIKLLFVPTDETQKFVYFPSALPSVEESGRVRLAIGSFSELDGVAFVARRSPTDTRMVVWAPKAAITL
jgi:hypothetical protein